MTDERVQMLTGAATFVDDVHDPLVAGASHAVFVRSTNAHAMFSVDVTPARSAPGVLAAIAAPDNPIRPLYAYARTNPSRFAQPLLAETKVRYVGEPIAVVVAETRQQAVDAAELVIVDYEPLPVVLTESDAIDGPERLFAPNTVARRHPDGPAAGDDYSNVISTHLDGTDFRTHDAAWIDHEVSVEVRVQSPRQVAAPIECRGAIAAWSVDGHLHYWVSTQTPHSLRDRLAPMYGIDPSHIHIIAGPFVGGGFGGKGAPGPEEQLVPHLAQLVRRPVRWIETRSENLSGAPQGRAENVTLRLTGTAAGELTGVKVMLHKDAGAYASSGAGLPNNWTAPMMVGTYKMSNAVFEQVTYVTNRPPLSALRGAGRAPIIHGLERAVDAFAGRIGMDPAELRRRNLLSSEQLPHVSPTGARYDDADYAEALERLLVISDYETLRARQRELRDAESTVQIGIGIASYNHRTCGGGGEAALVRIEVDGSATVVTGTTSQGQAHERSWRFIASKELGIEPERITVVEGRTDAIGTGVGAIGSRSIQTAGLAVHEASAQVVADALALAATMLEAAPADIVLDRARGAFHVAGTPSRSLGWADLAGELATRDEELECGHVYENDGNDVYPSGAHLAVVELDTETGRWTLVSYFAVDDAGVRVDTDSVDGQLHGGIALGIAHVMGEASEYDANGNPLAANFLDYQIISPDQLCSFELEAQVVPSSYNAGGYKAVGESGPIGATPAVHNAVLDALSPFGVEHLDIPCTPHKIWQAINASAR